MNLHIFMKASIPPKHIEFSMLPGFERWPEIHSIGWNDFWQGKSVIPRERLLRKN